MRKNQTLFIVFLAIILLGIFIASIKIISSFKNENEFVKQYSYTTAICDNTNFCQDHLIVCDGEEIISVSPITGAFAQFSKNWEDPRSKKSPEKFC